MQHTCYKEIDSTSLEGNLHPSCAEWRLHSFHFREAEDWSKLISTPLIGVERGGHQEHTGACYEFGQGHCYSSWGLSPGGDDELVHIAVGDVLVGVLETGVKAQTAIHPQHNVAMTDYPRWDVHLHPVLRPEDVLPLRAHLLL